MKYSIFYFFILFINGYMWLMILNYALFRLKKDGWIIGIIMAFVVICNMNILYQLANYQMDYNGFLIYIGEWFILFLLASFDSINKKIMENFYTFMGIINFLGFLMLFY